MASQSFNPIRVAAYCRVSTDHEDQLNSLDAQRSYFSDLIQTMPGWTLVRVFYDEGISGTQTNKRIGFHSMIRAAQNREIDLILTKEVSRFARNTVDALFYTRQLKEWNIGVWFTLDHIDTRDCDGELRLTLMASIAQEESRKTSERVKWGQTRSMERGTVFGRDLLGYHVQNGNLTVNESEAPVVERIFREYADNDLSPLAIARALNEDGIIPHRGTHWSAPVIYRILHNEKYVGDLCQKKSCTPNFLTHKKIANPDQASLIRIRDHHTPIIGRDLWNRTQQKLAARAKTTSSPVNGCYWCSGLIQCGICGHHYVSRTKRRKDNTIYRAWRCLAFARNGRKKCSCKDVAQGCDNRSINEQALLTCARYVLKEPLDSDPFSYRKRIDFIRIFPDHTLIIQPKNAPCAYRLTIHTQGRLTSYTTNILSCERIECIE